MLQHALALRLGRTVRELMHSLDAREWTRWQAYHRLSPIDDDRGDVRAGVIASAVLNGWKPRDVDPATPGDVMPDWGGRRAHEQQRRRVERRSSGVEADGWDVMADGGEDG